MTFVCSGSVSRNVANRWVPMVMMTFIGVTTLLSSSAWALNKVAAVNVSVTIFAAPPCEINSNNTINVNFGDDLLTSNINGVNYKKQVNYTLNCNSAASNALKMSIIGNGATFDTSKLRTSNSQLGIQLIRNGQPLTLNSTFNFTYPTLPVLEAVLVKQNNSTLSTGYFSGTATLVVEYQ
ncbi:exported pilin protein [Yersinia massiliensis]|uniref:fimbrial protein n=1 Tax=Yersinia massiliensis TaxID=419257 RepID=UPI0005DD882A|nr:exported pilin protein [Yersinia massiliensis]